MMKKVLLGLTLHFFLSGKKDDGEAIIKHGSGYLNL